LVLVLRTGRFPGDQTRGGGLTQAVLGRAPKAPSGVVEDEPETAKPLSCPAREEVSEFESGFIWNFKTKNSKSRGSKRITKTWKQFGI
jgi:hypothetical protein